MNVLLLRWDTKPDKRIRRTFLRPHRHAERLSMPPSLSGYRSGDQSRSVPAADGLGVFNCRRSGRIGMVPRIGGRVRLDSSGTAQADALDSSATTADAGIRSLPKRDRKSVV